MNTGEEKPPLEKLTCAELGNELGVDERSVQRWLKDEDLRMALGVVREGNQWRFPVPAHGSVVWGRKWPFNARQLYFKRIRKALKSRGKRLPDSLFAETFRREMGFGNPARERDLAVLRLALELQRMHQRKRLTKKWRQEAESIWVNARMVAARFACPVANVPKYYEKHLLAVNQRNRELNAPNEAWLREHKLFDKAKRLLRAEPRATLIAFVGKPFANGKPHARIYRYPLREKEEQARKRRFPRYLIQPWPVNSRAQLRKECERFNALWPSRRVFAKAKAKSQYKRAWCLRDLFRAARLLKAKGKRITGESLCPLLFQNEKAEVDQRPGIFIRTFRRRYTIGDLRLARRQAGQAARENPDEIKLGYEELAGMSIKSPTGYDLPNFYAAEDEAES